MLAHRLILDCGWLNGCSEKNYAFPLNESPAYLSDHGPAEACKFQLVIIHFKGQTQSDYLFAG